MTVYVDDAFHPARVGGYSSRWSHLVADHPDELHAFAARIGLKRMWFQTQPRRPWLDHYDVTEAKRAEAIMQGAVPITYVQLGERIAAAALAARARG
jgi:Protein of unknown function (DUF4031)